VALLSSTWGGQRARRLFCLCTFGNAPICMTVIKRRQSVTKKCLYFLVQKGSFLCVTHKSFHSTYYLVGRRCWKTRVFSWIQIFTASNMVNYALEYVTLYEIIWQMFMRRWKMDNTYLKILHIPFVLPVALKCYDMLLKERLQHGILTVNITINMYQQGTKILSSMKPDVLHSQ
jgi:hypothetical protein